MVARATRRAFAGSLRPAACLIARAREHLAGHQVPRSVDIVDALPNSGSARWCGASRNSKRKNQSKRKYQSKGRRLDPLERRNADTGQPGSAFGSGCARGLAPQPITS